MTAHRLRRFWDRYRTVVLVTGLVVGLALGVNASVGRIDSIGADDMPGAQAIVVASLFLLAGQVGVGYGWRRLAPALGDPVDSMWTFHATQPGKYLPLGVGQAVGQVTLARELGLAARPAMGAWASHLSMIVAAGTATGALLVLQPGAGPLRWLAPVCLLATVFAHRPTLQRVIGIGARFSSRLPAPDDLPSQRALIEAFLICVAFVVLDGTAFAILLDLGDAGPLTWLAVIGGYALAVGISTATPLPAGIGVRELLLVLVLEQDTTAIITAAIVLRVSVFAVEVLLLLVFWTARRYRVSRLLRPRAR